MTFLGSENAVSLSASAATAVLGLLLLLLLFIFIVMKRNQSRSLTDLKSLAQSYINYSENDDRSRSKSFTTEKKKSCISSINFRSSEIQALKLEAVLDLRVLKKTCRTEAERLDSEIRSTDSQEKAALMHRINPEGTSSSEDEGYVGMHKLSSRKHSDGLKKCGVCTAEFGRNHGVSVPIYHSDLVPWRTKMRVFGKLPASYKFKALGEICHLRNPEKLIAGAVVDPDVMGPKILYRLLLDHSKPAFAAALRLFAQESSYPVLVHCIHGKDRTGLIIMLILLICDVPAKLVVADYIQSELQLKAGRDKGDLEELEDFLRTDHVIASKAETMVETIAHLDGTYGGAREYCKLIGLNDAEVMDIIANFKLKPQAEGSPQLYSTKVSAQEQRNGLRQEKLNLQKEDSERRHKAAPATATNVTPHDVPVISDVALQAADEAIEDELKKPDKKHSQLDRSLKTDSIY